MPRLDQTVVVRGNRIVAVGPTRSTAAPSDARTIDARGKFLIPGLWDMHVHTSIIGGRALLALYVANGVTGVRDMAGDWDTLTKWRREIATNKLVGPRIVASGPYLEGGDVPIPHILTRTPEEGAAGVDSLVKLGVDFIKVHGQLTRPTYFAIARRAREKGIPFAGHVSQAVGSAERIGLRTEKHRAHARDSRSVYAGRVDRAQAALHGAERDGPVFVARPRAAVRSASFATAHG